MHHAENAVVFISDVPKIELCGGVVKISARSGDISTVRAMPVACFQRYIERAQRALRLHAAGDETIIIDD